MGPARGDSNFWGLNGERMSPASKRLPWWSLSGLKKLAPLAESGGEVVQLPREGAREDIGGCVQSKCLEVYRTLVLEYNDGSSSLQ